MTGPAPARPTLHAASPAGSHPLGELLTTRGPTIGHAVLCWLFTILPGYFGGMFLVFAFSWYATPPGGTPMTFGARVGFFVFGVLLLLWARAAFSGATSRYHFHELGVTRTIFGSVRQSVEYARVDEMSYHVTRNYLNGIYTGTDVSLELRPIAAGGRKPAKLAYSGKHREKPDGLLSRTFIQKNFRGEDELDAIKNIIALAIVQRWVSQGEFREAWCNGHVLTPRGLEFGGGPRKGTVIPYERIRGLGGRGAGAVGPQSKYDWHQLLVDGEKDGYTLIQLTGRNLWPGLLLMSLRRAEAEANRTSGPGASGAASSLESTPTA